MGFVRIISGLLMVAALAGCASDGPKRDSSPNDDPDIEGNRHPASYFIDRFQVEKDLPEHKSSNVPFFFKKCNVAGRDWQSRTQYECDVSF